MEQNSKKDGLFYDFWGRNHCSFAHISSKIVHSLKNTWLSRPYFIKKISILSKHGTLMSFFFSWIIPFYHSGDWSKKRKFCQNYTLLWTKKVNRMPFLFCWVLWKNTCSYAHTLSKHVHTLKRKQLFSFFNKFPTVMLIFHQKTLILLKLHNVLGHQS